MSFFNLFTDQVHFKHNVRKKIILTNTRGQLIIGFKIEKDK